MKNYTESDFCADMDSRDGKKNGFNIQFKNVASNTQNAQDNSSLKDDERILSVKMLFEFNTK
jgi:hypothetical protein